tara:strand:- start:1159 stop:1932 length:774 start_codon:yes stop_codon:yes gene_type:complete
MEIINQELKKMTTQIETLKEENGDLVDELDQKEDEYKELMEENKALTKKLAQSRSQVDIQSSNLSQTANGLRGKISYLEKQNQELTKQVSQEKKNHIIALKNKIALLEDELAKRPKKVEQVEQRTQTDTSACPRHHNVKSYTEEQKMHHFMKLINQYYEWIDPSSIAINAERAHIPFEFILNRIHRISGTKESGTSKFNMKGPQAYWPDQTLMTNYLKTEQKKRYGNWKCSSKKDVYSYNGCRETFIQMRFDLKEKQ